MRSIAVLPALLLIAATPVSHHYSLDPEGSDVSARVAFFFLGHKDAGFPKMSGSISLVPGDPRDIKLDVTLDARALIAGDSVTLKRLKSDKFFWVDKYSTIRFVGDSMKLTSPREAQVSGTLTARGVTRPETLSVAFDRPPKDMQGAEPISFTATTTIDRREFGMTAYSLIVGRNVDITIKARMVPDRTG
ncbi:YceI family protein [Tsuneonella mangrovi]|uniref:YceI family protein n=1 Tax=Tsuneonella mangrovi TaxID=1982042 RepID=UPI001F0AB2DD|nr:YceI family protein [Tsuneonella mangrovi]